VEDIKTLMRVIFAELCRFGLIKRIINRSRGCNFHIEAGHHIEDCEKFKLFVQDLIDKQLLQIGHYAKNKDVMMADEHTLPMPRPLVVYYTKSALIPTPCVPKPITIQVPMPFPYKDNKAVPWQYDMEVYVDGHVQNPSPVPIQDDLVTNITGVGGMTRSRWVYTPKKLQREKTKEVLKADKGKEKMGELFKEEKKLSKEVFDEEPLNF